MAGQNLNQEILRIINDKNSVNTLSLAQDLNIDHQKIVGAVKSLNEFKDLIETKQVSEKKWVTTEEGDLIASRGSHEALVWKNVPTGAQGIEMGQLSKLIDPNTVKLGLQKALALKWLSVNNVDGNKIIVKKVEEITDDVKSNLQAIKNGKFDVSI